VVGNSWQSGSPANNAAGSTPAATAATTTPSAAPPSGCAARLEITNSWPEGYQAQVTVRNAGDRALTGWTLTWKQSAAITNLWNGVLTKGAGSVTVASADYNGALPVNGTTTLGFTANGPAAEPPTVTCTSRG
jgi:cellulase/cellobiase CelA1